MKTRCGLLGIFIIMLTRGDASRPLTALTALSLPALAFTIISIVFLIVKSYIGFGIHTNPISCTSTGSYLTTKYNQSNYLNSITVSLLFAALAGLAFLVLAIYLRIKRNDSYGNLNDVFEAWSYQVQISMFLIVSVCILALVVPIGYFLAFWKEVGSQCNK